MTTADGSPVTPRSDGEGYDVSPGVAVRVSIDSAAYESAATNLPALPPGSTTIVDFGSLPLKKSALRLNARPYDSDYSMLTEGSASPVPVSAFIMNIAPRTFFSVIARHPGYVSKTNQFNLPPNVTNDFDFGQLEPLRTLLRVSASPRPFHLQVAWAGGDREFDNTEEVSGLPARQQITVTASAPDYEPVYKTVMLNPGETLDLDLGSMASALGFLLIQSAPAAESLTYVIDNNSFSRQGAGPIRTSASTAWSPSPPINPVTPTKPSRSISSARARSWISGLWSDSGELSPSIAAPRGRPSRRSLMEKPPPATAPLPSNWPECPWASESAWRSARPTM